MKVKVNGVWRDSKPQVKVAGSWRECAEGFVNTGGRWQQFLSSKGPGFGAPATYEVGIGSTGGNYPTVGYSSLTGLGSINPNTYSDFPILTFFTEYDFGPFYTLIFLRVMLAGTLPKNLFSRITVQSFAEFNVSDATFIVGSNRSEWSWITPSSWSGSRGTVTIYP